MPISITDKVKFEDKSIKFNAYKPSLSYTIHGSIQDNENAKDFMVAPSEKFKEIGKVELVNLKFIYEYPV